MHKHTLALTLLAAAFLTSCSDSDSPATPGAPSLVGRFVSSIEIDPASLSPRLVPSPFCPVLPPFLLPLDLRVAAHGDVNVAMTQVRLRFTDALGVQMPQVTLTQPSLTTQFGSTLVLARSSRTFRLPFRFGCETARAGTLLVIVDTRGDHGTLVSTPLKVAVR